MECSTNVAMRAGIIGFDTESHPIGSGRGVVLALLMECSAKVAVSLGIIRLDPQRFAIRRDGVVELAQVEERSAKVAMAIRAAGAKRMTSRHAVTAASKLPCAKQALPRSEK